MELSHAPIQSYTTAFYRYAHHKVFGSFDKYYTPFFEDNKQNGWEPALLPELDAELNSGMTLIPQVITNNANFLLRTAEKFSEMGFKEINLNMGCPFPMMVKRQKGAGLIAEPKLLESILSSFFKEVKDVRLSVKMRLGVNDPGEWTDILPVLNDYPVSEVIVHPRTAKQKYSGKVNWDEFEKITKVCKHPVTGNGDIKSRNDLLRLQARFPDVTSWMTGRGTLADPFLPCELKGITYQPLEKRELLLKFHDTYLKAVRQHYPVWNHTFNHLRTFWNYPLQNIENGKRYYKKLKKYLSEKEYQEWLDKYYGKYL